MTSAAAITEVCSWLEVELHPAVGAAELMLNKDVHDITAAAARLINSNCNNSLDLRPTEEVR